MTATELNEHLQSGGLVQVTTYTKSTIYNQKHAGMFEMVNGSLYVRRGKSRDCLSIGERMLVGIRLGRKVSR